MNDSIKITLAGKEYTIGLLTIGQLERLHAGVLAPMGDGGDPVQGSKAWWRQAKEILAAGLAEDHPDVTLEAIEKMRLGSLKAVKDARDEILIFAGFQDRPVPGAQPQGEAPAGAP